MSVLKFDNCIKKELCLWRKRVMRLDYSLVLDKYELKFGSGLMC